MYAPIQLYKLEQKHERMTWKKHLDYSRILLLGSGLRLKDT